MRAVQIRGTAKKIQHLVQLSKQALREGAYRVANRLHAVALNMEGRTAPEIAANLAPCSFTWHPQSLFCNPRRVALGIDLNVSQHPAKFQTSARLFTTL